ncbi:metal-dependent hydrolase [Halorhabdus salina]|uniref:metal-dependent hydrolase n=1 Tax=Halorhabdus salina TaxID=2750670 RepID=UPI0015EFA9F0|nr:metal-dependent hydrolase [Halorhabdus salina]
MHSEGHVGLGMLFYAPVAFLLSYFDLLSVMALGLVCAVFFSYAPDFDMQMPLVSHRGATHTLLAGAVASSVVAALALYLAASGMYPIDTHIVVLGGATFGAAFLGFLSHLAGDVITPMGIRPLRPWSNKKYTLDLVYAKNEWANEGFASIGAVVMVGAIAGGIMLRNGTISF